ncbi:MAG: M81 family metallopeptidase [Longicatena sp.]
MKVLVGFFTTESNANIPTICKISNYDFAFGDDCITKNKVADVFESEGIEMIPAIYANACGAGVIERETFDYIEKMFLKSVKDHLHELDGMYLHLHGASEVEGLGSGDHHILKEIRKIVGPYMPIAVVCDPHGNLTADYVANCTIIRSYRESPHTDANDTKKLVAKMLCDLLKNRQNIKPEYIKLPLILGGEQSVSADEPVLSINKFMDEMEKDPRIKSASWHVGYIRHDCPEAGCGVVVIPSEGKYQSYAKEKVQELADFVWNKRHEFHYTGLTAKPDEAIKLALEFKGKPVFITDSGDNVTSGATGWNTHILRQFLALDTLNKKVLFANINDDVANKYLFTKEIGESVKFSLGKNYDEWSKPVQLEATIKAKGPLMGNFWSGQNKVWGNLVTVNVENSNIDIAIATNNNTMCELHQFIKAGINFDEYDIIVVKQGYIFPELKKLGKLSIMSLTMGATPQDTASIDFKYIMRPMFPVDNI